MYVFPWFFNDFRKRRKAPIGQKSGLLTLGNEINGGTWDIKGLMGFFMGERRAEGMRKKEEGERKQEEDAVTL